MLKIEPEIKSCHTQCRHLPAIMDSLLQGLNSYVWTKHSYQNLNISYTIVETKQNVSWLSINVGYLFGRAEESLSTISPS